MQIPLLVAVEAAGEQHIDFAAEQGAKQGGGIAEGDQAQAPVGGGHPPVARKGQQALLLGGEGGQPVGPGADEAVPQGAAAMGPVSPGRNGREVDRTEHGRQGGAGALQPQFQFKRTAGRHGGHPPIEQVADLGQGEEALEAEHHGGRIEAAAVLEAHVLAQGDAGDQAAAAEPRQGGGQARLNATRSIAGIEGIAQGAEQLAAGKAGDIDRIDRFEAAAAGHHQLASGMGGLAAGQKGHGQGQAG